MCSSKIFHFTFFEGDRARVLVITLRRFAGDSPNRRSDTTRTYSLTHSLLVLALCMPRREEHCAHEFAAKCNVVKCVVCSFCGGSKTKRSHRRTNAAAGELARTLNSPLLLLRLAQHTRARTNSSDNNTRGAVTLLPFRPRRTNKLSRGGRAQLESTVAARSACTCASAAAYLKALGGTLVRTQSREPLLLTSDFSWRAPCFSLVPLRAAARRGREKRLASTHSRSVCSMLLARLVVCYVGEPNTLRRRQPNRPTSNGRADQTRRTVNNAC